MSVKIINGIKALKEGDTLTDIKLLVTDGVGLAVDFTTADEVSFVLGNSSGKILEKAATLAPERGVLLFGIDPGEITGYGRMFLEIHVTKDGEKQIHPEGSYLVFDIVKNLNAVGSVISTITIEQFELRIANKEQDVEDALTSLAADLAYYEGRFAVYEAQYNSMLNMAANVNAALGNMTNAANEQVVKAGLGATLTHTFTVNYVGKVSGSNTVNPHFAGSRSTTTLVLPTGTWTEFNASSISQTSALDGTTLTLSTATNGFRSQLLVSFNLIEAVQRKYGITIPGSTTAEKVAWLKQNLSTLNFKIFVRGSSATGNKANLSVWHNVNSSWTTFGTATHTSSAVTTLVQTRNSADLASMVDANGFVHYLAYADAASASVASTLVTDYFELDITVKADFSSLGGDAQTAIEYRINVLNPPKRTGLLPYVVGGDITTNTQRLQAMLAFLNTKGYGNLYFPNIGIDGINEGRAYLINDTLLMNYTVDWAIPITIEGEDYGSYIHMMDDTKPLLNINGVNNVRDFRIKNLTLRGGTYGIRIRWGAYVFIENVSIRGCATACMRFENTFGFCQDVWMFHTSSRLVEATGNGHIRWDVCTFGEDAGGFYLEDTEMSFNNCKFLQLKTYDTALTDTGIGGGDGVTGTKTRAIFYTLFNVNLAFTDCDFIHNEIESYLFYFVNSPAVYQFVNCKWEVGAGTSLFAFRNPSVYAFTTGLVLNSCEIDGVCELYSYALSDAIRHLKIVNTTLPLATMIEQDPDSAQLYEIGPGNVYT